MAVKKLNSCTKIKTTKAQLEKLCEKALNDLVISNRTLGRKQTLNKYIYEELKTLNLLKKVAHLYL